MQTQEDVNKLNWNLLEDYVNKYNDANTAFALLLQNLFITISANAQPSQPQQCATQNNEINYLKSQNNNLSEEIQLLKNQIQTLQAEMEQLKMKSNEVPNKLENVNRPTQLSFAPQQSIPKNPTVLINPNIPNLSTPCSIKLTTPNPVGPIHPSPIPIISNALNTTTPLKLVLNPVGQIQPPSIPSVPGSTSITTQKPNPVPLSLNHPTSPIQPSLCTLPIQPQRVDAPTVQPPKLSAFPSSTTRMDPSPLA